MDVNFMLSDSLEVSRAMLNLLWFFLIVLS
jgi:hypothetical protein